MRDPRLAVGWAVYVLRCADGTLYTGIAKDWAARLELHQAGRAARYTRGRTPVQLVHVEEAADRSAALRREAAIKRLTRAAKLALLALRETSRGAAARQRKKRTTTPATPTDAPANVRQVRRSL